MVEFDVANIMNSVYSLGTQARGERLLDVRWFSRLDWLLQTGFGP
jgi:hypothetical protein